MKRESHLLVVLGAIVGAASGYFLFYLLLRQGLYGLIIPGALLGVGAGLFKNRSITVAWVCGIAALGLGLFAEWRHFPFSADGSLAYFLTHLHNLKWITLLMIAAGGYIGFSAPHRKYLEWKSAESPASGGDA